MNERIWETHTSLGILIAVLALIALRRLPGVEQDGLRNMARFAPILPLVTGMLLLSDMVSAVWFIVLHLLLSLTALGLIEMASARQRRALARGRKAASKRVGARPRLFSLPMAGAPAHSRS